MSVFVISTYNTDYILIKEKDNEKAKKLLKLEGYDIISS
ncbi:MAG: ACT domain-containing protein [Lachnospiraceae bacterium]